MAAWLNTPSERWTTAVGSGRDKLAGHFVHQRQPVGRYAPAAAPDSGATEIRSMGEWFDPDGADVITCRDAFRPLWQALRRHWEDAVLMGSPSQTGRDLWSRTIPTTGKWAGGYPVLSEELRGLLHATGGQGRTGAVPMSLRWSSAAEVTSEVLCRGLVAACGTARRQGRAERLRLCI
ncbi:hypothetical protein [Kitasatospora mediocidica]|uniref:hypothetical protein n=1 Tax=Kitasatospora mediocidica TaxID=58352 RepID=UPI00068AB543|nr:hypothetical protein [Kitasatospora mediocidica]